MPFKDTKEGQTHYYGDGCGEKEHNHVIPRPDRTGVFHKLKQKLLRRLFRSFIDENVEVLASARFIPHSELERAHYPTIIVERNREDMVQDIARSMDHLGLFEEEEEEWEGKLPGKHLRMRVYILKNKP